MIISALRSIGLSSLLPLAVSAVFCTAGNVLADETSVEGSFIVNGNPVELPYVYVWREKEGFHNPDDPTWTILFVGRKLEPTEVGEMVWDAAYVEIGVTKSDAMSDDGPRLEVYSQNLRLSADSGGNLSGGNYPGFELDGLETGTVTGHIWQEGTQDFFDDQYFYDLSFNTTVSDPDAPIGDLLPAGGGAPGEAYLRWVETLQTGDLDQLLAIVPDDLAEQMKSTPREEAEEQMDFMRMMTPTDVRILGGSTNGEIAILNIEGTIDGETVSADITMTRMGDYWVPTKTSM